MSKVIVYGSDGEFRRTFLVDFMISSIGCPGTEELVAIGPHEGKILHVFDAQGKHIDSFGDLFTPPGELEPMKEMTMFGAPILFNCAKDGRIFVLNPHKYEVSVFKDRKLERVIEGGMTNSNPSRRWVGALSLRPRRLFQAAILSSSRSRISTRGPKRPPMSFGQRSKSGL